MKRNIEMRMLLLAGMACLIAACGGSDNGTSGKSPKDTTASATISEDSLTTLFHNTELWLISHGVDTSRSPLPSDSGKSLSNEWDYVINLKNLTLKPASTWYLHRGTDNGTSQGKSVFVLAIPGNGGAGYSYYSGNVPCPATCGIAGNIEPSYIQNNLYGPLNAIAYATADTEAKGYTETMAHMIPINMDVIKYAASTNGQAAYVHLVFVSPSSTLPPTKCLEFVCDSKGNALGGTPPYCYQVPQSDICPNAITPPISCPIEK